MSVEIKSITNLSDFNKDIEEIVRVSNLNYIEAVVMWCEERNVDVEQAASFVKRSQVIKAKIEVNASDLNFLQKQSKLPI
tara:strand:- start:891 stop:1130 length:240 start_codon:yes stop_codon:yes gene_type:complete